MQYVCQSFASLAANSRGHSVVSSGPILNFKNHLPETLSGLSKAQQVRVQAKAHPQQINDYDRSAHHYLYLIFFVEFTA